MCAPLNTNYIATGDCSETHFADRVLALADVLHMLAALCHPSPQLHVIPWTNLPGDGHGGGSRFALAPFVALPLVDHRQEMVALAFNDLR